MAISIAAAVVGTTLKLSENLGLFRGFVPSEECLGCREANSNEKKRTEDSRRGEGRNLVSETERPPDVAVATQDRTLDIDYLIQKFMSYPIERPDVLPVARKPTIISDETTFTSTSVASTSYRSISREQKVLKPVDTIVDAGGETRTSRWMHNFQALKVFKEIHNHTNVTRTKPEYKTLGNWSMAISIAAAVVGTTLKLSENLGLFRGFVPSEECLGCREANSNEKKRTEDSRRGEGRNLVSETERPPDVAVATQDRTLDIDYLIQKFMSYPIERPDVLPVARKPTIISDETTFTSTSVASTSYRSISREQKVLKPVDTIVDAGGETRTSRWMHNFQALKVFKEIHNHTNVTRTKPEYKTLGNWVHEQRRKRRNGQLSDAQITLLESLQFDWVKRTNAH
ncbi:hypothetical protein PROFUN_08748 [Planoprotostelium fungivorum]|uniref:Helicase-associated domain-containing protein n=1 Tax=Planoprotostelium fungivorum TaxID=1890364 RepID=A0A2P6ND49_9EUKA|nr:hypothetical protein PROFUN_08748 [Planoprotostelium fungivorum]